MSVLSQFSYLVIVLFPIVLILLYIRHKFFTAKYWSKRGVPHLEPLFFFGNTGRANITENVVSIFEKMYQENKKKKVFGFWLFIKPCLFVADLDIIKRIFIKDFNHFRDRGFETNTDLDPLAGHLFFMKGQAWRNLRVKLIPAFTSGKMKFMFPTMVQCGEQLKSHLKQFAHSKEPVEIKDMLARFTTDVISSCAFGIETRSLENPDSEFRKYGKRIFQGGLKLTIINIVRNVNPNIIRFFRIRSIDKDISDFFINSVKDTVEYRENHNTVRNDFLQIIIQLIRAGKVENVDKESVKNLSDDELVQKFSLVEAAAQCFVFFAAGFETSSSALTYGLYELALNPDIQRRLQEEIDEAMDKHQDQITYEAMCEINYLDMVVQEILRKHAPLGFLQRKCLSDYHIPEMGITVEKGTRLFFSVWGIHRDPEIYPNPEKFDPERFTAEEKNKRHPMAFLPFGEGPRNCIGNRFGLMQIKVGLLSILKNYTVEVCDKTPIPYTLTVKGIFPTPAGGMYLIFKPRA